MEYIKKNDISVVRRLSGGGAVYHDLGNLNFTFIIKDKENSIYDFKKYSLPVIDALKKMGVTAEFNSRNDLVIDGRKFSGNAQYVHKGNLLHHGTLLFNSELDVLQNALNVDASKIESKGIKSVRSRVTNISEYLPEPISIREFKSLLLKCLVENEEDIHEYILSEDDLKAVSSLQNEKYSTWEWNFGESPAFNFKNSKRFDGGKVEVLLNVERGGLIQNCKIYGDFLGGDDLSKVEEKFKGAVYTHENIENILKQIDVFRYFGSINTEELLSCFF
jgi:lipoate-protein ligase A